MTDNLYVGRTIVEVREMTAAEMEDEGWDWGISMVLILDNGFKVYASQDDEGNGPGTLFARSESGDTYYVSSERARPQ